MTLDARAPTREMVQEPLNYMASQPYTTIDKMSITGYLTKYLPHDPILMGKPRYGSGSEQVVFKLPSGGRIVEFATYIDPDNPNHRYKIEFNPNKVLDVEELLIKEVISIFDPKSIKISRLDVAIDYQNHDLGEYNITYNGQRPKKENVWRGRSGKIETVYLGAPASNLRHRIYDKALERMKEEHLPIGETKELFGDWWRTEAQIRNLAKWNGSNPFKGVLLYRKRMAVDDWEDQARVEFFLTHPGARSRLNWKQRKRLRIMAECEVDKLKPSPHEVYQKEETKIRELVASWIRQE